MSQLSKLSSSPTYSEASQIIPTLNYLIGLMNAAYGASGSGSTSSAIYIPTVASAVNLLSITPAATGGSVVVSVGGDGSDTDVTLIVAPKGADPLCLGGAGTSATNTLRLIQTTNSANWLQVTSATSATPTLTIAGAGASTDIGMLIVTAGAGVISVGGSTSANASLRVVTLANAANWLQVTGTTSALAVVTVAAVGATTDVNLALNSQGAGTLKVASGSISANASVATAITSLGPTNSRSNIQQWLRILDSTGASFFIPMW